MSSSGRLRRSSRRAAGSSGACSSATPSRTGKTPPPVGVISGARTGSSSSNSWTPSPRRTVRLPARASPARSVGRPDGAAPDQARVGELSWSGPTLVLPGSASPSNRSAVLIARRARRSGPRLRSPQRATAPRTRRLREDPAPALNERLAAFRCCVAPPPAAEERVAGVADPTEEPRRVLARALEAEKDELPQEARAPPPADAAADRGVQVAFRKAPDFTRAPEIAGGEPDDYLRHGPFPAAGALRSLVRRGGSGAYAHGRRTATATPRRNPAPKRKWRRNSAAGVSVPLNSPRSETATPTAIAASAAS